MKDGDHKDRSEDALADTELHSGTSRLPSYTSEQRSQDSDDALMGLLRKVASPAGEPPPTSPSGIGIGDTLCDGRFSIRRQLGKGGMGVVFDAYDHQEQAHVALKTLTALSPSSIYQLKGEFRVLADLAHPNLIGLRELFEDVGRWFFTMDLVPGSRLTDFLRDHPGEGTLRAVFRQVIQGMAAIHAAGKLHRDLKPSNVLVTAEGQVVILDFGLATEMATPGAGETLGNVISGTPAYMAPEQLAGVATDASDFYALGVMLFEALEGRLPFRGGTGEILRAKQASDNIATLQLDPNVPDDLATLCLALLQPDPKARPRGAELLNAFGVGGPSSATTVPAPANTQFVGRRRELEELESALRATDDGHASTVLIFGRSGMGKSALAEQFLARVGERHNTVVLSGRCYERESLPFKGFDALIDGLGRYLRSIPQDESASLMPTAIHALCRVFPTLGRVPSVSAIPMRRPLPEEPTRIRSMAFAALREMLGRLAERAPLVVHIDDLQWADQDSAKLLADLLAPPNAPALLFVATCRSEDREESPFLVTFFQEAEHRTIEPRELDLQPLSPHEATEVAASMLSDATRVRKAVHEASGHPFLLEELCRYFEEMGEPDPGISIASALRWRIQRLPDVARRLVEAIAVAGRPVRRSVVVRACGLEGEALATSTISQLCNQRVVLTQNRAGVELLQCYHDRVRETLVASLDEER
ncbi:MAG: protein kinase, partial [Myxococcales bacterium]|nr:protein kinase [Myxococcales bacterium]